MTQNKLWCWTLKDTAWISNLAIKSGWRRCPSGSRGWRLTRSKALYSLGLSWRPASMTYLQGNYTSNIKVSLLMKTTLPIWSSQRSISTSLPRPTSVTSSSGNCNSIERWFIHSVVTPRLSPHFAFIQSRSLFSFRPPTITPYVYGAWM